MGQLTDRRVAGDGSGAGGSRRRRASDADDLAALVARHGPLVYRLAVAVVHDHSLAEDVVQEVMFKAWRSIPADVDNAHVRWLRVVTRNTAIDLLRRRKFDDYTENTPDDGRRSPATDRVVEGRQHLGAVWDALAVLDEESRTMLILREAEDVGYREIAELLGTTSSAVKSKLYRARHVLRQQLTDWEDEA